MRSKAKRQIVIKTIMLAIVTVMVMSMAMTVLSQVGISASAEEVMTEQEIDNIALRVIYIDGKGCISFPMIDFGKMLGNDRLLYEQNDAYLQVGVYDDMGLQVVNKYEVDMDSFDERAKYEDNYFYFGISEILTSGMVSAPPGGFVEGDYVFLWTLVYRSLVTSSWEDEDGIIHMGEYKTKTKEISCEFHYPCDGVALPDEPEKDGYTFNGWYYDEAFTRPYKNSAITEDTKLYAKMTPIVYTIDYMVGDGVTLDGKETYTVEDSYTLPIPKKPGYKFKGWYTNESCTGEPVTEIAKGSIGNKVYYAKFEIELYTVTFYVDGEVYLQMEVEYGTRLINFYLVDPNTMRAVSLCLTADLLTEYDLTSEISEDIMLFSDSEFLIYVGLTYNIDGEETMDLLDYNSSLSKLRVPEKEGYNFDGWYYDSEFKSPVEDGDKLTSNTTVYAKFKEKTSTTIKAKVGEFFSNAKVFLQKWWWAFAVGGGVILVAAVVGVVFSKRR